MTRKLLPSISNNLSNHYQFINNDKIAVGDHSIMNKCQQVETLIILQLLKNKK